MDGEFMSDRAHPFSGWWACERWRQTLGEVAGPAISSASTEPNTMHVCMWCVMTPMQRGSRVANLSSGLKPGSTVGQFMRWATSWSIFGKRVKSRKFYAEAAEAATSDHLPGNRTAKQIQAATFCYSEEANMDKISVPSDFMLIHSDVVETIQ